MKRLGWERQLSIGKLHGRVSNSLPRSRREMSLARAEACMSDRAELEVNGTTNTTFSMDLMSPHLSVTVASCHGWANQADGQLSAKSRNF